jgi:hypothetical protein
MSLKHIAENSEAWELVFALSQLHAERLKTMNFIFYRPILGLLDRLGLESHSEIRAIFQEAFAIRDAGTDRRHFFEIALSLAITKGLGQQVIEEMLREPDPRTRLRMAIDINGSSFPELLKRETSVIPREDVFAIASKCSLIDGTEAHLPMMDFRIKPNPHSLEVLATAMKSISPIGGAVLQSKNSYHFYGVELLDAHDWSKFLGKSLLLQGLTDDRYVGHRLRERFCVLRISRGPFQDDLPFVVETW